MLTARDDEIDVVTGLEVGADDYLTKPFTVKVLVAHIRAVLRRYQDSRDAGEAPPVIRVGQLTIDETRHLVKSGDQKVDLTPTEFELLTILARRPGWVFSRSELIDRLRDGQQVITERAIDVQIANLRKKLGSCDRYVQTVRGVGYRMLEQA
jgi:two-component system phosphate regulon response regulator PhoB